MLEEIFQIFKFCTYDIVIQIGSNSFNYQSLIAYSSCYMNIVCLYNICYVLEIHVYRLLTIIELLIH